MSEQVQLLPGDKITMTITGTIADPKAATVTTVSVNRPEHRGPSPSGPLFAGPIVPGLRGNLILDSDAEIKYMVTSQYKNGVHIDAAGRYWMRKPDGWHEMSITPTPVPDQPHGLPFVPDGVNRLFYPEDVKRLKGGKDS